MDKNGKIVYNSFLSPLASSLTLSPIAKLIRNNPLLFYRAAALTWSHIKSKRIPSIQQLVGTGWRLTKYRTIRWIAQNALLGSVNLDILLAEDKLTFESPQLRMF